MPAPYRSRGLTLVETCVVLAVAVILAAAAWPAQRAQLERARRLDGTLALTRLQIAQEQYRVRHGRYGGDLSALGPARSPEGYYLLAVADATADTVTLIARARADGPQRGDAECRELSLRLNQGLSDAAPSGRCWGR
ncbi:MAG TPA: type IV pilin protein [Rubrivivax sp.]|nr:type IV pilin protein [Burkholderiales bacterium]HNT37530.1 type IV pilin protein [Rubrivivax sp.]